MQGRTVDGIEVNFAKQMTTIGSLIGAGSSQDSIDATAVLETTIGNGLAMPNEIDARGHMLPPFNVRECGYYITTVFFDKVKKIPQNCCGKWLGGRGGT